MREDTTARVILAAATAALVTALATGCGGGGEEAIDDLAARDPSMLRTRGDYRYYCSPCHARNGLGAANLFPPLGGSGWVVGDPEVPILIVLHGLEGEITVDGKVFRNQMPPLGHRLNDEKIASILTYVRGSWGNDGSAVSPAQVARVRAASTGRDRQMTEAALKEWSSGSTPPAP